MALCLVVEDQATQRRALEAVLRRAGYQVLSASNGREGLKLCLEHRPECILLDVGLPDANGIDLIPEFLGRAPMARIVVLTAEDSLRVAVSALRAGARHYLVKPWHEEELLVVLEREVRAVNIDEVETRTSGSRTFWGRSPAMLDIRDQISKLATSPLTPVMILGETGTGKEIIAREIHDAGAVPGSFVAFNCAAVPGDLMESELFGHERGAFTGADTRRRGLAELADCGTLFFDEVGELSVPLQAKTLRFLQDGSFRPLGGERELSSGCRIVAATSRDVDELQETGRFRSDLYFRLAVVRMTLPPLRQRQEDLLPLTRFLLEATAQRLGRGPRPLSPRAEAAMVAYHWPGNVRELANRLERALVLGSGSQIEPHDLDLPGSSAVHPRATPALLDDAVRLRTLLEEERWNLSAAARRLGVPRHRLKYRVRTLGLQRPDKG